MSKRNKYGFTLAELLIVVAIIAVLVAVSIPIFTSQLAKAKAATCLSNRESLKRQMAYEVYLENMNAQTAFDAYKSNCTCPSGGTISYEVNEFGLITIKCSEHGSGSSEGSGSTPANAVDFYSVAAELANSPDIASITGTDAKAKALQAAYMTKYMGSSSLKTEDISILQTASGSNKDLSAYYWIPTYTSTGEMLLLGTSNTYSSSKSNYTGSFIYYGGNYYYYYYNQNIGSEYVGDKTFDISKLTNAPTDHTSETSNIWIKIP